MAEGYQGRVSRIHCARIGGWLGGGILVLRVFWDLRSCKMFVGVARLDDFGFRWVSGRRAEVHACGMSPVLKREWADIG